MNNLKKIEKEISLIVNKKEMMIIEDISLKQGFEYDLKNGWLFYNPNLNNNTLEFILYDYIDYLKQKRKTKLEKLCYNEILKKGLKNTNEYICMAKSYAFCLYDILNEENNINTITDNSTRLSYFVYKTKFESFDTKN